MTVFERLANSIIVPVVVIDDVKDAVPTANAMAAGGVDVMEITFRTACAPEAIKTVSKNCPNVLVGAGTIINVAQAKLAVKMGAKFIVSPGFDEELVKWCIENDVLVCPGCVTPTEIMAAMKLGLKVVKYFPTSIYGGLKALKALSGPFADMKFITTSGISTENIKEFIDAPFVHAVGGSWICPKEDIVSGNFEKITQFCRDARNAAKGEY